MSQVIREQLRAASIPESEAILFEPVIAKAASMGASVSGLIGLVQQYGTAAIKIIQFVIEYGTVAIQVIKRVLELFPAEIPKPVPGPTPNPTDESPFAG